MSLSVGIPSHVELLDTIVDGSQIACFCVEPKHVVGRAQKLTKDTGAVPAPFCHVMNGMFFVFTDHSSLVCVRAVLCPSGLVALVNSCFDEGDH